MLSVIVPIYNEQETLKQLLSKIARERTPKELILVDDGSCDRSSEIIDQWLQYETDLDLYISRFVWLEHRENLGKGRAIRSGLNVAKGKYVVIQDADLEVLPADYPKLLEPLLTHQAEFVIGSRIYPRINPFFFHRLGVQFLNRVIWLLYGYNLSDSACCFKLLKRAHLLEMSLQCRRFEFCPEVIAKASHLGLKLEEISVSYFPRTTAEGKKLKLLRDGVEALYTLLRYYFWSSNQHRSLIVPEDQTKSIQQQK